MGKLFLILGILCLAYYLGIIIYAGVRASFSGFWLALGAAFLFASAVCICPSLSAAVTRVPRGIRIVFLSMLAVGIAGFLVLEGCIVSGMAVRPKEPADYVIVLGAQVKGMRVSRNLRQRLDAAYAYLSEHEGTLVIVSGGQGPGEEISEAEAMAAYLEARGISAGRILKEDRSVNTEQNLRFSQALITREGASVVLVSSDFHIFRAVHIARAKGMEATGVPARSDLGMYPHNMVREAFALVKDLILGNAVL